MATATGGGLATGGQQSTQRTEPRRGLMQLKIGAQQLVRCKDGEARQYRVHDKKSYPKAKSTVVCFYCKNAWPTKEALIEAHPADAIMRKQSETHLYAYWSEDSLDKLAEGERPKMTRIVGLLSDEE